MIAFGRTERWLSICTGVLLSMGCRGPMRPADGPESPASPAAEQAEVAVVTRALDEDPPLPGEDLSGWGGLAPVENGPVDPLHEHHHHHDEGAVDRDEDEEHDQDHDHEAHEHPHEHDAHGGSSTHSNDQPPFEGHHGVD